MPLLLIPVLLAAIVLGVFRLYASAAARFGAPAGVAAVVLAAAAVAGVIAWFVHRHRFIHGKTVNGRRVLKLDGNWGRLVIDADRKRGVLDLNGQSAEFIFADIRDVARLDEPESPVLALRLRYASQSEWHIPMADDRQARRWRRILSLAAEQKL